MRGLPRCQTRKCRRVREIVLAGLVSMGCNIATNTPAQAATVATIYTFETQRRDVQRPSTNVTIFRGAIYGIDVSSQLYKIRPLHDKVRVTFQASNDEYYQGPLVACDAAVYGVVPINDEKTYVMVRIDPVTHVGSVVHTFPGSATPSLHLACLNSKLYGTLELSGGELVGRVFSFDPASSTYSTIHTQTQEEGAGVAQSGVTAHGGMLYGAAFISGNTQGLNTTVYSLNPATGQETTLHQFPTGSEMSGHADFPVFVHGSDIFVFLYNSTNVDFYIYRVNATTGKAKLLYDFDYGTTGAYPNQSLTFDNGLLYGTLQQDKTHPLGTIYSLDPMTGAFTTVYAFTGGTDGEAPRSGLTLAHGVLYGTTAASNAQDQGGTVFTFTP